MLGFADFVDWICLLLRRQSWSCFCDRISPKYYYWQWFSLLPGAWRIDLWSARTHRFDRHRFGYNCCYSLAFRFDSCSHCCIHCLVSDRKPLVDRNCISDHNSFVYTKKAVAFSAFNRISIHRLFRSSQLFLKHILPLNRSTVKKTNFSPSSSSKYSLTSLGIVTLKFWPTVVVAKTAISHHRVFRGFGI